MGVTSDETTAWDGVHFQRERQTGVFMGLNWLQVGVLAVGLGVGVLVWLTAPVAFPLRVLGGTLIALATFAVAVPRPNGLPLVEWTLLALRFQRRGVGGHLRFRREWHEEEARADDPDQARTDKGDLLGHFGDDLEELSKEERKAKRKAHESHVTKSGKVRPGKPHRLHLAGEFDDLLLYELPTGEAMLWDPRKDEAIIVAGIRTEKAFDLESVEHKEDRTRAFSEMLTGLARIDGIEALQMSDQTTMISGSHTEAWYEHRKQMEDLLTGADVDPFLDRALSDEISREEGTPQHVLWLAVTVSLRGVRNTVKQGGGGIGGMMRAVKRLMTDIDEVLPATGAMVDQWHTPRSLAAVIRSAFDPESSVAISERVGELEGVAPHSAGPMAMDVHRSHVATDSGVHRTYMISEWPQVQADFGFLRCLIFLGDFRHTVTVIQRPQDQRKAIKGTRGRKSTWESSERVRRKWGGAASEEHRREYADIEDEEKELINGSRALKQIGLITVTGTDEEDLASNCQTLLAQAPYAMCEVRPLWWQQDSGFVAAALPLARISIR